MCILRSGTGAARKKRILIGLVKDMKCLFLSSDSLIVSLRGGLNVALSCILSDL